MEDILASIRRILSEDEAKPTGVASPLHGAEPPPADAVDDVLMLDASMLVEDPVAHPPHGITPTPQAMAAEQPRMPEPVITPPPPVMPDHAPPPAATSAMHEPPPAAVQELAPMPFEPLQASAAPHADPFDEPPRVAPAVEGPGPEALVAPEAAAAAASSVSALLRHLQAERQTAVHRGGPTIEDIVREEMRPALKLWLDTHLPPLVERLVREEIARVVARAVS